MLSIITFFRLLPIYTVRFGSSVIACYVGLYLIVGFLSSTALAYLVDFDLYGRGAWWVIGAILLFPAISSALIALLYIILSALLNLGYSLYKLAYRVRI